MFLTHMDECTHSNLECINSGRENAVHAGYRLQLQLQLPEFTATVLAWEAPGEGVSVQLSSVKTYREHCAAPLLPPQ